MGSHGLTQARAPSVAWPSPEGAVDVEIVDNSQESTGKFSINK